MQSTEIEKRRLTLDELAHTEDGVEFWYAREIMEHLGYARWENFHEAIKRAMISCETGKTPVDSHFREVTKMAVLGAGTQRPVRDYKLTRYACYLIAMNGDPRKEEVAFAQSYFAIAAHKQELIEQRMGELQRLSARKTLAESEKALAAVAFERDVDSTGFARIKSRGDSVLFGGNSTSTMKKKLGVPEKAALADFLPDVAIAAKNLANSMTAHNVVEKDLRGVKPICDEHMGNNGSIRKTLVDRGIRPEELPAEEDTKKVERRVKADERHLKAGDTGFFTAVECD